MREPVLRCKRCSKRFVAAPYVDGTGRPAYCPACTMQMQHVREDQFTCARCQKTFTAVRRDPRVGLPTHCPPCGRMVYRARLAERSSRSPAITAERVAHWHNADAKQPAQRRFGPAVRRSGRVGWDRATRTFRGVILEVTGKADEIMRLADWDSATIIIRSRSADPFRFSPRVAAVCRSWAAGAPRSLTGRAAPSARPS